MDPSVNNDTLVRAMEAEQRCEDLMTLLDFCNEAAWWVNDMWHPAGNSSPKPEVDAIRDAHDMAHVILGGDRTRDWIAFADAITGWPEDMGTEAWPDVQRHCLALFQRHFVFVGPKLQTFRFVR